MGKDRFTKADFENELDAIRKHSDISVDAQFRMGWDFAVAFVCRNTIGECFCGCHVTEIEND